MWKAGLVDEDDGGDDDNDDDDEEDDDDDEDDEGVSQSVLLLRCRGRFTTLRVVEAWRHASLTGGSLGPDKFFASGAWDIVAGYRL